MRATAIIPVKRFGAAKQRLLRVLDRPERAAVVRAMLSDVLAAVTDASLVELVIVVTGDRRAERTALHRARRTAVPIEVLRDPDDAGHREAARLGVARALALRAECAALLPGDCPLLAPDELDAALERMRPGRVAIVPDRHGSGTNALLLSPPDAIHPGFGEGSRERHLDWARRAGVDPAVEGLESLALDLDTPDDLAALGEELARRPERAPATAAALERFGLLAGDRSG